MRTSIVFVALFLLPLAPLAGGQTSGGPSGLLLNVDTGFVDITDPEHPGVNFLVEASDDRRVFRADIFLVPDDHRAESFMMSMQRTSPAALPEGPDNDSQWEVHLPRTDPRLTTGEWSVYALVYDDEGNLQISNVDTPPRLDVAALDVSPSVPDVRLFEAVESEDQFLGPSGFLRFEVESNITRKVTYQVYVNGSPGPEFPLPAPHILQPGSLLEGEQIVVVRAYDRAYAETSLSVNVLLDTQAPVMEVVVPERLFTGVPFEVAVATEDTTSHQVVLRARDQVHTADLPPGSDVARFPLTFNGTAPVEIVVEAQDRVGNTARTTFVRSLEPAFTELRVPDAKALDSWPLPGEPVRFEIQVEQVDGVVVMPVGISFSAGQSAGQSGVDVSVGETRTVTLQGVFQPGRQTLQVVLTVPEAVQVEENSTLEAAVPFEVFLGKTVHGEAEYFIRADNRGLPVSAVPHDTNRTLALTLVQEGGRSVYEFTANEETLFWDPQQTITTIPVAEEPVVDTPAMGPLAVLALLGVGAWVARRRA